MANSMAVGQMIELLEDLAIDNVELRWGQPSANESFLHKGLFVVEAASGAEVRLADANVGGDGRAVPSSKHGHVVKGEAGIRLLERRVVAKQVR